jgi:hypothetical protein
MATYFIKTNESDTPITLSVNVGNGHKSHTVININDEQFDDKSDSFNDLAVGTNKGLKHSTMMVYTKVLISNKVKTKTHVESDVKGAIKDVHDVSDKNVAAGAVLVTHTAEYNFI